MVVLCTCGLGRSSAKLHFNKELHCLNYYVIAYPVAPHPPTGFVPAPAQAATYGGNLLIIRLPLILFQSKYIR